MPERQDDFFTELGVRPEPDATEQEHPVSLRAPDIKETIERKLEELTDRTLAIMKQLKKLAPDAAKQALEENQIASDNIYINVSIICKRMRKRKTEHEEAMKQKHQYPGHHTTYKYQVFPKRPTNQEKKV